MIRFLRDAIAYTFLVLIAVSCIVALGVNDVNARGPVASGEPVPVEWDCLPPGYVPGDVFGPGPADVVPSAPPCPIETPHPSSVYPLGTPEAPQLTLPPTDTP